MLKQKTDIAEVKPDTEIKGLEALSLYNLAMIDIPVKENIFDIPKILPVINAQEDIMKNGGEKIYSSDGKLHSIVRRDENTVTVFTPDADDENKISAIQVFDKSNRLIKTQQNENYDGMQVTLTKEYNPENGRLTRYTEYRGDMSYSGKTEYGRDGEVFSIESYNDNGYYLSKDCKDKNLYANMELDNKKQIKYYHSEIEDGNVQKSTSVSFYNGIPYEISKAQRTLIPNVADMDFMEDADLKPAEYILKEINLKDIEGKSTYYSNGEMETNCFSTGYGEVTAHFLPDGTCDKLSSLNKEVIFENDEQTIKEKIGEATKYTTYVKSVLRSVRFEDKDSYKQVYFYDNNKPASYEEGFIKDNETQYTKWLDFNKDGLITWAR